MKKKLFLTLIIICTMLGLSNKMYAQKKDTLHIYYAGLQTQILDSNDVKISKWAKSLKGKHYDIELYSYYDDSQFKKYMNERVENLHMVVLRKARDLTTVKFMEPVKGKKSQRGVADIVFISSEEASAAAAEALKAEAAAKAAKDAEKKSEQKKATASDEEKSVKQVKEAKQEEKKQEKKQKEEPLEKLSNKDGEYIIDSLYVNGELQVVKRKIEKK